ncbi:MAG: nucleotidyltransferase [Chitinophagaceae bacterium]|nr:nucleotidyltransferase [Chitinophagaceae bacterium]
MARTITDIQQSIIDNINSNATLSTQLTSTSATALWRLWAYIIAVSIWALENLFDFFKSDVDETIAAMKPHSLRWYAEKAKLFQYGYSLPADTDVYDNTAIDPALIEASKIVDYAAVVEQQRGLRIKVAQDNGTDLEALITAELNAFKAYMERIKDAGVKLTITSGDADLLKLSLTIKYDALVLLPTGGRIDGTSAAPVKDAIKTYLKNLPFNGILSTMKLIDAIQAVEGVKDLSVNNIQAKYGALPFSAINITYTPDAGYLRAEDADLTIIYEAG